MNSFCMCLSEALQSKFEIDVDVFVSKKRKIVHFVIKRTLNSVLFLQEYYKFQKKILGRQTVLL